MKKLTIFILLFTFIVSAFSACTENADESSEVTSSEAAVSENSATNDTESSEPIESSEPSTGEINIPEFDINNVLYYSRCESGEENDVVHDGDESSSGLKETYHYGVKTELNKYDTETLSKAYLYVIFYTRSGTSAENVSEKSLKEFLEAYGYIENEEKTASLGDTEVYSQVTVGYLPYVTLEKLSDDCKADQYTIDYTWLNENCFSEGCVYYYYFFE